MSSMALNALVDSFLPQSEKNVGLKGLTAETVPINRCIDM